MVVKPQGRRKPRRRVNREPSGTPIVLPERMGSSVYTPRPKELLKEKLIRQLHVIQVGRDPIIQKALQRYVKFRRVKRSARTPVTNPFSFNTAESAALRDLRRARRLIDSPEFREQFARLPLDMQREVTREYNQLLKEVAAIRLIARNDRKLHDRTPAVFNKRAFDALVYSKLTNPSGKAFTAGILDIDHFKSVNDTYGHPTGDFVLDAFSKGLADVCARNGGFAGRVGGEEFEFYIPGDPKATKKIIDDFRAAFAKKMASRATRDALIELNKGTKFEPTARQWERAVTFTAGISGAAQHDSPTTPAKVFKAVDAAMVLSKKKDERARTVTVDLPRS